MEEMNFVENLMHLSSELLKWKREEKHLFDVEVQRQKDGVIMRSTVHYEILDFDELYRRYRLDRSYVRRRIDKLKWYIRKLVNSGRLENRDWRHIETLLE